MTETKKDFAGREYAEFTDSDGDTYREYKLQPLVAKMIKYYRIRRNCTWRVIAIKFTGFESQMTGKELCRLAQWTLGEENNEEWD